MIDPVILGVRQWYADNALACIRDVASGAVQVNCPTAYAIWQGQQAAAALAGEFDHTFTFRQHVHFVRTGDCVALLP